MHISLVIFTNVLLFTNIKDFNPCISFVAILIAMEVPITFPLVNMIKTETLYKDVPEIISNKLFFLTIFLTVFLIMLPFMLYRRFSSLVFSAKVY